MSKVTGYSRVQIGLHWGIVLLLLVNFFTHEAMKRLEDDTLARCDELIEGRPVTIRSSDPRLRTQSKGVVFG